MASKVISTILNLKDNFSDTIQNIAKNTQSFRNGMKNTEDQALNMKKTVSDAYDTIGQSVLRGIGFGAGMDIWGQMKEGIIETVTFGNELQKSLNGIQAATGISDDALGSMRDTMLDIYNDNFGENFDEIGEAIKGVRQQTGASGDDLKDLTEDAIALRDTFGYDVSESVRSANTLMKQFGIDGNEAYNLIAQGQQDGLNFSGELIDSINEYSVQFNKLGLNAEDMFNIFDSGVQSGAFNLDKIGDAVKEFSIRAIDGSNTTIDGFSKLGLNADEMAKKFGAGGETAKEAFFQVTKAIGDMNDPVKQSIVGVDLFGTMWEDLGPKVVTQLGYIGDNFSATYDTMNQIKDIKYDDIGSALEGIKRNIQTSILIPISDEVLPRLNDFANWFKNKIPGVKDTVSGITNNFLNISGSILDKVLPSVSNLGTSIGDLAKTIYDSVAPAFDSIKPDSWNSVGDAIKDIIDRATGVVNYVKDNWPTIGPIVEGVTGAVVAWKLAIIAVNTWIAITTITASAWETIELIIWGIVNATSIWEGAIWAVTVAMDANPVGAVTLAIAALGFVIYEVVKHWQDICQWISKAWDFLKNNPIASFILECIPFVNVIYEIAKHWDDICNSVQWAWDKLKGFWEWWNGADFADKTVNITQNAQNADTVDADKPIFNPWGITKTNATGTHYWPGGPTRMNEYGDGEMAILPSGSKVIPAGQTNKILNGNGNNGMNVYIIVQGNMIGNEEFADQIGQHFYNQIQLGMANSKD
ncbi:phage tail tape measure protein [Clostridium beijerinckii]|uniref:phage tail tape measure protein n=1 Tax=Clostridium beijerinckii TaxID=1520 RepID=UPI001494DF33|nr:phage tail tape measure protein [Clostridium beijerinckii]NOW07859.1 TP901 family phage tail tape measure protein [Clostridium beijerinckii]NYC05490.1 TP901 family phage tail tape measure protein [Clostridium beijerinckii]